MSDVSPQFDVATKLSLREAQFKILTSREAIRISQDQLAQLETGFQKQLTDAINALGLKTASLDLATLTLTAQVAKDVAAPTEG